MKNSFRGISPAEFARKLLNVRSPETLKFTEISALVPFSTATGDYLRGAGSVPRDADDPPTRTVIEQLEAIRSTLEGYIVRIAERLIGTQYVCDVAEGFGLTARFPLPEIFGCEYRIDTVNEIFGAQKARPSLFTGNGDYRNEASVRLEKRSESVPIALLTSRSRNNLVEGVQDGIERRNIGRAIELDICLLCIRPTAPAKLCTRYDCC